jgi:F-type H+-transporting ATPase subunit b
MDALGNALHQFGVYWPNLIAQVVLFAIVYWVLKRYAFRPVIAMLEERRRRIEEGQLNAEKIKKQEAITAAEQITLKAQEAMALERERIMAELKQELGRLVVDTTVRVTGKVLTPQDHQRINEETARQMAA